VENKCPEGCTLHIIYSTHKPNGLPQELLNEIFRNATIHDWQPLGEPSPKRRVSLNRVIQTLAEAKGDVTMPELQRKAGVRDRAQFKRMIKSAPFLSAAQQMGRKFSEGDNTKPGAWSVRT